MSVHTHGRTSSLSVRRKRMEAEARAAEEFAKMTDEERERAQSVLPSSQVLEAAAVVPLDKHEVARSLFPVEPLPESDAPLYVQEEQAVEEPVENAPMGSAAIAHYHTESLSLPAGWAEDLEAAAQDPDFAVSSALPEEAADLDAFEGVEDSPFDEEVIEDEQPPEPTVAERLEGLTVSQLENALAHGDFDELLDELEAAELAGKARKGAIEVIRERQAVLLRQG